MIRGSKSHSSAASSKIPHKPASAAGLPLPRLSHGLAGFFEILQRTIRQVLPDAVVAPYLVVGSTDSRHYRGLTENVYCFLPLRLHQDDLARMHGTNERVSIEGHADGIRFYRQLILNSNP